jgi:HME family heavy-metal exporter
VLDSLLTPLIFWLVGRKPLEQLVAAGKDETY